MYVFLCMKRPKQCVGGKFVVLSERIATVRCCERERRVIKHRKLARRSLGANVTLNSFRVAALRPAIAESDPSIHFPKSTVGRLVASEIATSLTTKTTKSHHTLKATPIYQE